MNEKQQVRRILRKRRDAIPTREKEEYDRLITDRIIASEYFENAKQILLFSSTGSEFDTCDIINISLLRGKSVFLPRCTDNSGHMKFLKINSTNELTTGMYGIKEPKVSDCEYSQRENDIIIVPALSIDREHIRIGYGKGYYDRFLKEFCGTSICPCYEMMRTEKLPADKFDIKITVTATETGLYTREVIL